MASASTSCVIRGRPRNELATPPTTIGDIWADSSRTARLDGRSVKYLLFEQPVRLLKGKLRLRQVTRLLEDGHQTAVLTSRWDLRDIHVAYRMFERWRQENFFK